MIWFLSILSTLLFVVSVISIRFNIMSALKLMALEDQTEESLDILDECYQSINTALQTDVFSDEPLVKRVISDIKTARDAVLIIAGKISGEFASEPRE